MDKQLDKFGVDLSQLFTCINIRMFIVINWGGNTYNAVS